MLINDRYGAEPVQSRRMKCLEDGIPVEDRLLTELVDSSNQPDISEAVLSAFKRVDPVLRMVLPIPWKTRDRAAGLFRQFSPGLPSETPTFPVQEQNKFLLGF